MTGLDAHTEQLLALVLSGVATSDQFAEFNARLHDDDALLDEYIRLARVDAAVYFQHGCVAPAVGAAGGAAAERDASLAGAEPDAPPPVAKLIPAAEPAQPDAPRHARRPLMRYAAAAAVLIAAALIAITMRHDVEPASDGHAGLGSAPGVATLLNADSVEWADPSFEPTIGHAFGHAPIRLARGAAQLVVGQGAALTLAGPAELRCLDPHRVRLDAGTLTTFVPHNVTGFTVDLPGDLSIVDLGTEFGVTIDPAGRYATVHVFDGAVRVTRGSQPLDRLPAGRAIRVSLIDASVAPEAIVADAAGFAPRRGRTIALDNASFEDVPVVSNRGWDFIEPSGWRVTPPSQEYGVNEYMVDGVMRQHFFWNNAEGVLEQAATDHLVPAAGMTYTLRYTAWSMGNGAYQLTANLMIDDQPGDARRRADRFDMSVQGPSDAPTGRVRDPLSPKRTFELRYTTTPNDVGKPLRVRFEMTRLEGPRPQACLDDVTLTLDPADAKPQPPAPREQP